MTGVLKTRSLVGVLSLFAIAGGATPTMAQTTKPATHVEDAIDPWEKLVERFALASFKADAESTKGIVAKNVTLAGVDGTKVRSVAQAMRQVADGKLVTIQAYQTMPQSLASDIAKAVKESPVVPEDKKAQFEPADESAMNKANETAAEWVRRALAVDGSTALVGVIMVWHPKALGDSKDSAGPVFLLVSGKVGEGQEPAFLITRIAVGAPVKS